MPLPRYPNRVPIELNLKDNLGGHVPAYNQENRLWFTVPSSSFIPEGAISSSEQIIIGETSGDQFAPDRDFTFQQSLTVGQNLFVGNDADVGGNLNVDGRVTALEFHTQIVSSSIIYRAGSTKFGDTGNDVHSFTGSLFVVGSISAESTLIAQNDLEVNGFLFALGSSQHGNDINDTHRFTGSLLLNGNAGFNDSIIVSGSTIFGSTPSDTHTFTGTTNVIGNTSAGINPSSIHSYTGSVYVQGPVFAEQFIGPVVQTVTASFATSIAAIFAGLYDIGSQIPIRK
jgi:hypothetical protein